MPRSHVLLQGSHRTHRAGSIVLGRAEPHSLCEITIKVRRQAPLPEPTSMDNSPLQHSELTRLHSANPADMEKVADVLAKYGIELTYQDAVSCLMRFQGPVRAMEKAFCVHLFRARKDGRIYRARTGDIHIPRQLVKIVQGVFGLDTRSSIRRNQIRRIHDVPQATIEQSQWYLPADIARIYNFPPGDGAGQTIGLIELGGYFDEGALAKFLAIANIATPPKVEFIQVELPDPTDPWRDAEAGEVMLDVEVVAGICPQATIPIYFSNFTDRGWIEALGAVLRDIPNREFAALSISFGHAEGEGIWTPQAMAAVNDALKAVAGLGITVCVATGDDGSSDRIEGGPAYVDFPASSPYVLAVGGTTLTVVNGVRHELAWKQGNGLTPDGGSSGGGVSSVFPRPSWQGVRIRSVNPQSIDGRCIPDVAANAATSPGYAWVAPNKNPTTDGGTSAAAPLWASLIARLNAALGPARRIRFLTPLLYQANAKTNGTPLGGKACNDITEGDNITAHSGGYRATVGYDAVTGWGSPDGQSFLQFLP